jgi:hypothetical protein
MPTYAVPPAPRTWAAGDIITSTRLRADATNLAWLFTQRPLAIAGQQNTNQSIPASTTDVGITLDTKLLDAWGAVTIGTSGGPVDAVFPGWYLCEGNLELNSTSTTSKTVCGVAAVQNAVTTLYDGESCGGNGVNDPGPTTATLVQLNPNTSDTVNLYCYQNSSGAQVLGNALIKVEWVALPTSISGYNGTVVTSPQAAVTWPPGTGTLITNAGGIAAGATSMTVASATGMITGGYVGLDWYDGAAVSPQAERVEITSVAGTTIGISATSYAHGGTATPGTVSVPVSAAFLNQQLRDIVNFLSYPPVFHATNSGSGQSLATQTFPAGTAITFTSAGTVVDNFSGFNGTNEYVFPVSGVYFVYGQVYITATDDISLACGVGISGGTIGWGTTQRVGGSAIQLCASVRRHVRVTAGQYAQIFGSQGTGSSVTLLDSGSGTYCRMIVVWRGF